MSTSGRGARVSYQTMLPEISARRSLVEPRITYPSPGREREKCRLLDLMWQIPFIHSVQFVITSNFHIYIEVCRFFLPSGTDTYVLVWWVFNNCACAFQKHWARVWERLFKVAKMAILQRQNRQKWSILRLSIKIPTEKIQKLPFKIIRVVLCRKLLKNTLTRRLKVAKLTIL